VLSLVCGVLVLSGRSAFAKIPPWTCELSTTRPVVGQPVVVTIRFWNDAEHTDPARWWDFLRGMPDFLHAHSVGRGPNGSLGAAALHARVERVRPGVYRGRLVFPDARPFRVSSCGSPDNHGYPFGEGLLVRPRPFQRTDPGNAGRALARTTLSDVVTIAAVGLGFAVLLRRRIRERSAFQR